MNIIFLTTEHTEQVRVNVVDSYTFGTLDNPPAEKNRVKGLSAVPALSLRKFPTPRSLFKPLPAPSTHTVQEGTHNVPQTSVDTNFLKQM